MKRAIVTGGSGYFGSLLCKLLVENGWEVKNIDINPPNYDLKNYTFIKGDINDLSKIEESFIDIDSIFHNVALVPITKSKNYKKTNLYGTKNTIELAVKNKIKSFIYTSSSAIYGVPKHNPVSEHEIPSPAETYGQSKLTFLIHV